MCSRTKRRRRAMSDIELEEAIARHTVEAVRVGVERAARAAIREIEKLGAAAEQRRTTRAVKEPPWAS